MGLGPYRRWYRVGAGANAPSSTSAVEDRENENEKRKESEDGDAKTKANAAEEDKAEGKKRYEKKLEWVVKKHLQWLGNEYLVAQHVHKALSKGSFEEALLLTRMASRKMKVEVAWNHLIDYHMKKGRLHAAVKLYNEMKKRAQIPNAKTYTIIFRGCAQSLHPKLAVSEATRIYNFMLNLGSLKPNTIHMNAVLEVCARWDVGGTVIGEIIAEREMRILDGGEVPGWKAVEGRGSRQYKDIDEAFGALTTAGISESILYERRPLTPAQLEKALGKQQFRELLEVPGLVVKEPGKPTLAPIEDKRPAYSKAAAVFAADNTQN